jgi:hypothetical protein
MWIIKTPISHPIGTKTMVWLRATPREQSHLQSDTNQTMWEGERLKQSRHPLILAWQP